MKITRYFTKKQLAALEDFLELYGLEFRKRYSENMHRAVMDALIKSTQRRDIK